MFSKTLTTLAVLLLAVSSISAQCVIDDFNNCDAQPPQYTSNSFLGDNFWFTAPGGGADQCWLNYLGNGNPAITEALYPPMDLETDFGLPPGQPVAGSFILDYTSGDILPSGAVLKLVAFGPQPLEICVLQLEDPFFGPVQFQLPNPQVFADTWGFVLEDLNGNAGHVQIDDLTIECTSDPAEICGLVFGDLPVEAWIPPTTPPCMQLYAILMRYWDVDAGAWVYCPQFGSGADVPDQMDIIGGEANQGTLVQVVYRYVPMDCDDGDPCTEDFCVDGVCVHIAAWEEYLTPPALPADADPCLQYIGVSVVSNFVYNEAASTVPQSYLENPSADELIHITSSSEVQDGVLQCDWTVTHIWAPIICDDGDPCTEDLCVDGACQHIPLWEYHYANPPLPANPCLTYLGSSVTVNGSIVIQTTGFNPEDASYVEVQEGDHPECAYYVEHWYADVNCDDDDPCTVDTCDENGNCVHTPLWEEGFENPPFATDPCDVYIGSRVTVDGTVVASTPGLDVDASSFVIVENGGNEDCLYMLEHFFQPKDCDDGDPCTIDTCDEQGNCVHTPVLIGIVATASPAKCPAYDNGSIEAFVNGGTGPYVVTASLFGPLGFGLPQAPNAAGMFTGLEPGMYLITAVDANGCTGTKWILVDAHSGLEVYVDVTKPTCWDDTNGQLVFGVEHGTEPYQTTFKKMNDDGTFGASTAPSTITQQGGVKIFTYSNLGRGTYAWTVTDADGCSRSQTVNLTPVNSEVKLTAFGASQLCPGPCAGTLDISIEGGKLVQYAYTLDGGATWTNLAQGVSSVQLTGMCGGTYTVQAKNNDGCLSNTITITLNQPADWNTLVAVDDIACAGQGNGGVSVEWTGGTPGYTTTHNGNTAPATMGAGILAGGGVVGKFSLYNQSGGTGSMTITDVQGCTKTVNWTIAEPSALYVDTVSTLPAIGGNDGEIDALVGGGTPGYLYQWIRQDTVFAYTQDVTDLEPGWHELWVTDAHGCTDSLGVELGGIPLNEDPDGDLLSTWTELNVTGTDPYDADSDDDLLSDGEEVDTYGTDPLEPNTDGDEAGDGLEVLLLLTDPLTPDVDASPIVGCTYPEALNYDPAATLDNDACLFDDFPSSCPADADGDGEIGTPDLLTVLGAFGGTCEP